MHHQKTLFTTLLLPFLIWVQAAAADQPDIPGNLRAAVYSTSAAEIFWDRQSPGAHAVNRYEISRDGILLDTRDALSYFDDTLSPGIRYSYAVRAIDSAGNRSAAASVTLTTNGSRQEGPEAPASLRGEVYSSTALELFWLRAAPGTRYEVFRDGQRLVNTDGISFFDNHLIARHTYIYNVVAIDAQGNRSSEASTITLSTGPVPPGIEVPAPANARLDVYSSTAVELFWDRPPASAQVVSTRVTREGVEIARTNGTSYFDSSRSPGQNYTYELTAIDRTGAQSASVLVSDMSMEPLINANSDEVMLREVVALANEDEFDAIRETSRELVSRLVSLVATVQYQGYASANGLTYVAGSSSGRYVGGLLDGGLFTCDAGGSVQVPRVSFSMGAGATTLLFDECVLDSDIFNGEIEFGSIGREGTYDSFADFSRQFSDGTRYVLSGRRRGEGDRTNFRFNISWTDGSFTREDADGVVQVRGFNLERVRRTGVLYGEPDYYAQLPDGTSQRVFETARSGVAEVSFSIVAPWTAGQTLDVGMALEADSNYWDWVGSGPGFALTDLGSPLTLSQMQGSGSRTVVNTGRRTTDQWNHGHISIHASDGSQLRAEPAVDDAATLNVFLNNDTHAIMRNWSDFQVRCLEPLTGCR